MLISKILREGLLTYVSYILLVGGYLMLMVMVSGEGLLTVCLLELVSSLFAFPAQ